MVITAEMFEKATGHPPELDDLDRCNCEKVGSIGHQDCGWDTERGLPNFMTLNQKPSQEHGGRYLMDSDDNPGERLRLALALLPKEQG